MDREEFIENQAAFQLGACDAPLGLNLEALARSEGKERHALIFHDPADQSFVPAARARWLAKDASGEWRAHFESGDVTKNEQHRATRKADLLSELYALGIRSPLIMDMSDAVHETNRFPAFQYNRPVDASNSILWPLKRYHGIGSRSFCIPPDASEPGLAAKGLVLCWRGVLRGYSTLGGNIKNIGHIIKSFVDNRIDRDLLLAHLNTVPRYVFVSRYFDVEGFDIGFHLPDGQRYFGEAPDVARYVKPYAPPTEQLQNKYQISIQGTDVASSFGWQLGTNCVILREPYPWVVFFDGHFHAWDHYVPIAADFSDVPEKIAWCERNPAACQQMIEKRHELVELLLDREIRHEALKRVVARYDEFYSRWAAG